MLRRKVVLAAPLVCLAAAGCGSGNGVLAARALPAVAPAFVFMLTPQDKKDKDPALLSVFQVDADGDLHLADQRTIEDAKTIVADPKGRFVFVAGGKPPKCTGSYCRHHLSYPGYLRTYAVDTVSGILSQRSERTTSPDSDPYSPYRGRYQVELLTAGDDTLYALLEDVYGNKTSLQVGVDAASGALNDAPGFACYLDDWLPRWILAAGPRVLIGDDRSFRCAPGHPENHDAFGVYAPALEDGGRLHRVAGVRWVPPAEGLRAYAGAGGRELAALANNCVVVAWGVGGLTAFALDPGSAVPLQRNTLDGPPPQALAAADGVVAVGTTPTAGSALDLYALTPTCDLVPTSTLRGAAVSSLAFHPDGRYLHAAQPDGIHTYFLRPDGRWEERGFIAGATGTLVAAPNPGATY